MVYGPNFLARLIMEQRLDGTSAPTSGLEPLMIIFQLAIMMVTIGSSASIVHAVITVVAT